MTSSTRWFLIILAILAVVAILFTVVLVSVLGGSDERTEVVTSGSGEKIAVVDIKGVITSSDEVVRQLKKYRGMSSVKAVLLRIDSPGGGVVASQEMYEEVRKTRDAGTPVVVSMGSLAASGGYYVACGASRIVANRGTLTGSIGVIAEFLQLQELLGKIGVDVKTIKSGKLKDSGTQTRKMTEEEQKYFQALMDDVHRQFMGVVQRERHLSATETRALADGRVYTGEQAVPLGLVDTLGTYEDAVRIAAAMAGINGEPAIVKERKRRSWIESMAGDVTEEMRAIKEELLAQPVLSFRFTGSR
jgi:protease IV